MEDAQRQGARLRGRRDACAAALLVAAGGVGGWLAGDLGFGTARRMGPGYFPTVLAYLLLGSGLALGAASLRSPDALPAPAWRPLVLVTAAILAFALTIDRLGLVPSVCVVVALAALADRRARPAPTLALAAAVAGASWLLFSVGLGLPLPAFRWGS